MERLRGLFVCGPTAGRDARSMLLLIMPPLSPAEMEIASLVVTELVTNAVRHGCEGSDGEIEVGLDRLGSRLRVEVAQPGPLFDLNEVRLRRPGAERGWGVLLLDRLTSAWGVGTSEVWAELNLAD